MNCIQIQSMITPFINDELNIKELEVFLDHVYSCPKCMEEVEIYYTLLTAMKQLDEDKSLSGDFKHALRRKLEEAQERIVHAKYTYYRKKAILIIIITVIAFVLNFSYTSELADINRNVTESDFKIRSSFKSESYYDLERQMHDYMETKEEKEKSERIIEENADVPIIEDDINEPIEGDINEPIDGAINESIDGNINELVESDIIESAEGEMEE